LNIGGRGRAGSRHHRDEASSNSKLNRDPFNKCQERYDENATPKPEQCSDHAGSDGD